MVASPAQIRSSTRCEPGVTYEEYHPYGTTAWWAEKSGIQVSRKRYRYTGMERDEETGLGYHSARYYAPWLGRWERPDPAGLVDGPNRFAYARGNPVGLRDPSGEASVASDDSSLVLGPVQTVSGEPPSADPDLLPNIVEGLSELGDRDVDLRQVAGEAATWLSNQLGGKVKQGLAKVANALGTAASVAALAEGIAREWLPGIIAAPVGGVFEVVGGLLTAASGLVSVNASGIREGLEEVGHGLLSMIGLKEIVAEPRTRGAVIDGKKRKLPTGLSLPESMTREFIEIRQNLPPNPGRHGMHAWHAATNAAMASRLGPVGAVFAAIAGVVHESPLDRTSFQAEQHWQGTVNHLIDSTMDIVANMVGIAIGLLLPHAVASKVAARVGNLIPGPGDPDPDFGGMGAYQGQPSEYWGGHPWQ